MTDPDVQYRPLGYDGPLYYIYSGAKQQLAGYTASQLMSAAGLLDIVPDHEYWAAYPSDRRGRPQWQALGAMVMQHCLAAGLFDPGRVRGRGVWLDRGRTVVHLGPTLLVDGEPVAIDAIESDWLYQARPAWVNAGCADLTVRDVLDACRALTWEHPMHAELLAGWIACAPVCGALTHRPHITVSPAAMDVVRTCVPGYLTGDPGQDARPLLAEGWVRSPGACMVATTGKMEGATLLLATGTCAPIHPDTRNRLFARQLAGLPTLLDNIAVFGDPLMAGAWSLYSTERLSPELARGFAERYQ